MSKTCAYCGRLKSSLTKEHIFPKGTLEREPDLITFTMKKGQKVFEGEPVIKDVCADCNNGPLSKLDAYLCQLHDTYFKMKPEKGDHLTFQFEWVKLVRVLLKISFNSARVHDIHTEVLSHYSKQILAQEDLSPDIGIWLELTPSSEVEKTHDSGVIERRKIEAYFLQSGELSNSDLTLNDYIIRYIAINAFWFYLAIPVPGATQKSDNFCNVESHFSEQTRLIQSNTQQIVKTSGLGAFEKAQKYVLANQDKLQEHYANKDHRENIK